MSASYLKGRALLTIGAVGLAVLVLYDLIIRVVVTGLCIASGWWLIRKVTSWLLPWSQKKDVEYTVASDASKEVTPTYISFR